MKSRWIFHKLKPLLPFSNSYHFSTLQSISPPSVSSLPNPKIPLLSHVELSSLLNACGREGRLLFGSSLHASIIKNFDLYDPRICYDYRNCVLVWNSLLSMYAKCRVMGDAVNLFDEMPVRDTVSWNSIISGFLANADFDYGFQLFKRMWEMGIVDQATFTMISSACGRLQLLSVMGMVHCLVISSGFEGEVTVGNALITAYFECGYSDSGRQVFNEMRERTVVTWTAVISGLTQNQFHVDSLKLFREMCGGSVQPNYLTYLSLLSACSGLQALREGQQIHGLVCKLGVQSDLCIESALMDMYSKCGMMEEALQILYSASKVDDVSMTIILAGFAQNGLEEEAILFFVKLIKAGVEIDPNMVSAVLGVFGVDTSVGLGQQIHSLAVKKSFGSNLFVSNGLINMYSKCGNLDEATKVFSKMPHTNSISWNSMIAAFARHGDGLKALTLFEEMIAKGVEPTDVTFLSLLHACSHMGLVEKGMELIKSMVSVHGIAPRMEHYACIVDMLGRAGLLEEAKRFITDIPSKPGVLVWQALLGACTIHGDPEMGKYAAEKLFSLTPNSPAPYILLANIYSSRGRWKERAKTIKTMKDAGVAKETGISWIEIDNKVHSFVVWDKMHPQCGDIYNLLARLFRHMRDEGYCPDKRYILYYQGQDEENSIQSGSPELAVRMEQVLGTPVLSIIAYWGNLHHLDIY